MSASYPGSALPAAATADAPPESAVSGTSWPAIFAGAIAALATTLILLALGSGLGLASVSPWSGSGASATTFTVMAAIWLIVVQWLSSLMAGYLTGRLRTKWVGVHTHEVFFRDTANGLVAWALATIVGAAALTSAVGTASQKALQGAANVASNAASATAGSLSESVTPYDVDRLLRSSSSGKEPSNAEARAEITRILTKAIGSGEVSAEDRDYLSKLIASRTGISEADAQKRVNDVITDEKAAEVKIRQAADTARKAAASTSIYLALSMLIGAFIASAAAALGGRLRDSHP